LTAGILLVDKPAGPSSHDIVARVRKTSGTKKVGHAGTLDPFASGLLLTLVGSATRLSEYFLGMEKQYEAVVRLGVGTDSHDSEGKVVSENQGWEAFSPDMVEDALKDFRGPILQKPPAYSAKKVRGEAAHRRVRRGESVDLEPVEVVIEELALLSMELPEILLLVRCSSGTYVRSLARDLGRSLEVGAHLTGLRRTSIGPFSVDSAVAPGVLDRPEAIIDNLIPPSEALSHFPAVEVDREDAGRIRQGRYLPLPCLEIPEEVPVRILLEGDLVALAAREGRELRPRKVFANG